MSFSRRVFIKMSSTLASYGLIRNFRLPEKKKIAVIISECRPRSHADVIVNKLLGGYYFEGKEVEPRVQVVSMYTDQVPDEDLSWDLAAKYKFRIYSTIREALTLTSDTSRGPRNLAVDGVMIICEHGAYPYNEMGQKLYPRYEFFKEVMDVFRETGKVVPVFNDKHLSYDWYKAKWMYDQSHILGFPLMAGSSLPLALAPEQKFKPGIQFEKAVGTWEAAFFDSKDSYGFHALEQLQCRVERREGGETGITGVQCFAGNSVWEWTNQNSWAQQLLEKIVRGQNSSSGFDPNNVKDPILFLLEYNSGLQAAIYRINGQKSSKSFAAFVKRKSDIVFDPEPDGIRSAVYVPEELRQRYPFNGFSAQVFYFEQMVLNNTLPNPVDRTLLTTGALAALFESSYQPDPMYGRSNQHGLLLEKGKRILTPHLKIAYQVSK